MKDLLILVGIIVISVLSINFIMFNTITETNSAKDEIKSLLKFPSTAKFSGIQITKTPDGRHVLFISGTVNSQNSFGMDINNNFECKFEDIGYDKVKECGLTY